MDLESLTTKQMEQPGSSMYKSDMEELRAAVTVTYSAGPTA